MRAVVQHRHVAVPAAHDVSKSHTVSRLAAWWIEGHPPGEAFVVIVGAYRESGRRRSCGARSAGRTATAGCAAGSRSTTLVRRAGAPRSWSRSAASRSRPEGRSAGDAGVPGHPRPLRAGDPRRGEGIPPWLFEAAESLATNEGRASSRSATPTTRPRTSSGICRPGSGWHVIPISAFDSPNFTNEPVPEYLRELLVSKTWVEERRQRWGEDSNLYSRRCWALPRHLDDSVITPAMVKAAQLRDLPGMSAAPTGSTWRATARTRRCSTGCAAAWCGSWRSGSKADTVETTNRVRSRTGELPEVPIVVDADGIGGASTTSFAMPACGSGVDGAARRCATRGASTTGARSCGGSSARLMEDGRYRPRPRRRRPGGADAGAEVGHAGVGRIRVETKEEMAGRGRPSPDRADAVIFATLGKRIPIPRARGRARAVSTASARYAARAQRRCAR
jgi:hypothetical protein